MKEYKLEHTQERSLEIAHMVSPILEAVDRFVVECILDDDYPLYLEELRDILSDDIENKEGMSILATALGKSYDSTYDRITLESMDAVISLIKVRLNGRKKLADIKRQNVKDDKLFDDMFGGSK